MQTKAPPPEFGGTWGKGENAELLLNIMHRVAISDDEQILEMDIDDGYVTLWMNLDATELCTLKIVKVVNFMVYVIYHNFLKNFFK